jgi:hypothetical protein
MLGLTLAVVHEKPESFVNPNDCDKALAVHNGPHPGIAAARNIGFYFTSRLKYLQLDVVMSK